VTKFQAPAIDVIRPLIEQVFGKLRVVKVTLHHWHLTFVVSTARYDKITGAEIQQLASLLGVDLDAIELWDVRLGIEFAVYLDPKTPAETIRAHRKRN
jgi:hypothetical protein